MDKELIAMCDCPEIQDRWEPKVGDIVHDKDPDCGNWYVTNVPDVACMNQPRIEIVAQSGRGTDNIYKSKALYIPRIEDMLEWLGEEEFTISSPVANDGGTNWSIEVTPSPSQMPSHLDYTEYSGILIKALLKAYMHLEHNKTWNGEAWA